jgi:Resolvase, N terminal domain
LLQVRYHTGSTTRQYDLVGRAVELGWPCERIRVVDQDQGQSGVSAAGRDGFQWLVAEVGLGHAGAVLSLEASRLARSCSDWYRLLEICAVTYTLGYCWRMGHIGARAAKREVRVLARGRSSSQATSRSMLMAAAMATCCRCVFANPR